MLDLNKFDLETAALAARFVNTEIVCVTCSSANNRAPSVRILYFFRPRMTYQPARHRIRFRDVAIGQRFYDPISEEYFVKQTVTTAAMVTGIGDGTIPDDFEPDDIVGIDH